MKITFKGFAIILALFLLLIPSVTLAADYEPEESATIYTQVLDASGDPVTDATVTLDVYDSGGNLKVDGVSMTHVAAGVYKYDLTMPADEGVYFAVAVAATYGQDSMEIHIITPAAVTAIWEEGISGYTDSSTFGGLLNSTLGGDIMMLVLLGMMALGLLGMFFWKKSQVAAYGAAGLWVLLGIQAFTMSSSPSPAQIQDTYMGLFWLGIVFCIACILLPLVMREKPSKDDIYVEEFDEVTGDKIEKVEPKLRRKRQRSSRFNRTGE